MVGGSGFSFEDGIMNSAKYQHISARNLLMYTDEGR